MGISLLSSHPEGIVLYDLNVPHAILLTDYTNVFVGKPYEVKVNITNPDYRFIGVDTSELGYLGQTGITGQNNTFVRLVFCKIAPR